MYILCTSILIFFHSEKVLFIIFTYIIFNINYFNLSSVKQIFSNRNRIASITGPSGEILIVYFLIQFLFITIIIKQRKL